MDGDAERSDDTSSGMEDLWTGTAVDDLLFSRRGGEVGAAGTAPRAGPVSLDRHDLDALRSHLDVVFDHIVTALAEARTDAVAATDARVSDLQERLVSRLDALDAAVAPREPADVDERLDRMAEQASHAADAGTERMQVLEAQMQEVEGRVDAALESQRRELVETRSMIGPPMGDDTARLDTLEADMSELLELHAALDAGLGSLRSEIGALRVGAATMAGEQADLVDRMEASAQAAVTDQVPQGRGRKPGRKGEATAQLADQVAALAASTGRLAGEQRDLKAHVARLEQELRASARAANRTTELSALGPLRSDVNLLGEQLAEQNEALDSLRKSVERLRRKPQAPAQAPAPPATRGARPISK